MKRSMFNDRAPLWRGLALAVVSALFLLVGVSVTPQAKTAPPDEVKAVKAKKQSPGKGCVPAAGTEAYKKLMTATSPTAPPPPVRRVGLTPGDMSLDMMAGDTQWCWKQSCVHDAWTCSQGVSEDVNGCCVRCCWEGTSNCSESRCCDARAE